MSQLVQNTVGHELNDALEKVSEEAGRLQTVINTVPSILWTSFPDGSKEYLNKRWYEYTGLPQEQGNGWDWKVVVHPDDLDRLLREYAYVHRSVVDEFVAECKQAVVELYGADPKNNRDYSKIINAKAVERLASL